MGSRTKTLFDDARSAANLFSAWRHVKKSALNSKNSEIRGSAAEFESNHQRHLKTIGDQLRRSSFKFRPVQGVLVDKDERVKKGKKPRPIAIAPIENRIVQRAILQVLQPRRVLDSKNPNSKIALIEDNRLGKINRVNKSKFGVGGLIGEYGGVKPAISLLLDAMRDGKKHYYKTDIRNFFSDIPKKPVVDFIRENTQDDEFSNIFSEALKTELANEGELSDYLDLFPTEDVGVAQGSSLSAFSGNVLLYGLDHDLNDEHTTAVRYIDDLVILADENAHLEKAIDLAKKTLGDMGFTLHAMGTEKSEVGLVSHAFEVLGCTLQPGRCVPSKESVDKFLASIEAQIQSSKQCIKELRKTGKGVPLQLTAPALVSKIGSRVFGWEKSFEFCTDSARFKEIDIKISKKVLDYDAFLKRETKKFSDEERLSVLGIPSMANLHADANKP